MAESQRGVVRRITFEIEYPDGSRKVTDLEEPEKVGAIVFDSARVPAADKSAFDVSEADWKQNPSMLVYPRVLDVHVEGRGGGIPFCTHNKCSI